MVNKARPHSKYMTAERQYAIAFFDKAKKAMDDKEVTMINRQRGWAVLLRHSSRSIPTFRYCVVFASECVIFCDLDNNFECPLDYNNEPLADYLTTILGHRHSVVEMFEKFNAEYQTFPLGCSCIR
jgi:hypothetical protein